MSNLEERVCKVLEESCLKAFEAGKQSQDAEMERLKTLNETLTETNAELASLVLKMRNQVNELQKRIDEALFEMRQLSLMLGGDIDGYKDPAQICQSEGIDMGVKILEKALRGEHV